MISVIHGIQKPRSTLIYFVSLSCVSSDIHNFKIRKSKKFKSTQNDTTSRTCRFFFIIYSDGCSTPHEETTVSLSFHLWCNSFSSYLLDVCVTSIDKTWEHEKTKKQKKTETIIDPQDLGLSDSRFTDDFPTGHYRVWYGEDFINASINFFYWKVSTWVHQYDTRIRFHAWSRNTRFKHFFAAGTA